MRNLLTAAVAVLLLNVAHSQHQLVKLWETDTILKVPESVLFDGTNRVLYVSNIDGTDPWGKDGKGSIGKVDLEGKIIAVDWVKGLNAPKGMALYNGLLYVADLNSLIVIDVASGTIAETIAIEGAQGLNDVSIDRNGVVYVSDSRGKQLFKLESGRTSVIAGNLKGPNGVLAYGPELYLLDAGTMYRIEDNKTLTKLAEGLEGGSDGIESVVGREFIVSAWSGMIWYIHADGTKQVLLDTREQKRNTADIGYDGKSRIVYVPTFWKNSVVAYELK